MANPSGHILAGSHTGSGKTLGYLAPIFHFLKQQEKLLDQDHQSTPFDMIEGITASGKIIQAETGLNLVRKLKRPRAIVLVPSRHLIEQVIKVSKTMAHHCKLRTLGMHTKTKNIDDLLNQAPSIYY